MITSFLGHLHPVLLHLPIGIFSLAFILFYFNPDKSVRLSRQLGFILLLSWISAMISAGSGLLLNTSGEYNEQAAETHQWSAIAFTILCGGAYFLHRYNLKINQVHKAFQPVFIAALIAMVFTGHAGGSLTHGADFLLPEQEESEKQIKVIPALSDTSTFTVYDGLVQPLLASKCENCHKAGKQKGGLRMDDFGLLLKGGKNGKIIQPGDAASSEMMARILLPGDDDKHMPPKGKKQLTENEIALLHWWIAQGADNKLTIQGAASSDTVRQMLQPSTEMVKEKSELPTIPMPDSVTVNQLKQIGFLVKPIAAGSGWLEVSSLNMTQPTAEKLQQLVAIATNVYSLNISGHPFSEADLSIISKLANLKRLDARNTGVSDRFVATIAGLEKLEYLNLVGTSLTDQGLKQMMQMKGLKKVYCWNTGVTPDAVRFCNQQRPDIQVAVGY
jgi:mono/diheme cytochrome c family protein/uncharacterized membrane protein